MGYISGGGIEDTNGTGNKGDRKPDTNGLDGTTAVGGTGKITLFVSQEG